MHKATLYIVATPIGNLQDIGIRAIKILTEIGYIACEDTRKTGFLLKKMRDIYSKLYPGNQMQEKPYLLSYFEQNEEKRIPEIINFLKNGQDIALVCDAGTPAISQ